MQSATKLMSNYGANIHSSQMSLLFHRAIDAASKPNFHENDIGHGAANIVTSVCPSAPPEQNQFQAHQHHALQMQQPMRMQPVMERMQPVMEHMHVGQRQLPRPRSPQHMALGHPQMVFAQPPFAHVHGARAMYGFQPPACE